MKRDLVYIGLIVAAFIGGASVRFHSYAKAYYRTGWRDGTAKLQREAVFSGHASFQDGGEKMYFVWNSDTLGGYDPARVARENDEAILPVETDWFTRLLSW